MRVLENYVGGRWVDVPGAELHDVTNPASGEVVAQVPFSAASDLDAAVQAARQALPPGGTSAPSAAPASCSTSGRSWSSVVRISRAP